MGASKSKEPRPTHHPPVSPTLERKDDAAILVASEAAKRIRNGGDEVDLNNLDLTDAPPTLPTKAKTCLKLNLRKNKLTKIPDCIAEFTNLVYANFSSNLITDVPAFLGECHELESLDLRANKIERLPYELANCEKLKYLYLDGNEMIFPSAQFLRPDSYCFRYDAYHHLEQLEVDTNELMAVVRALLLAPKLKLPWWRKTFTGKVSQERYRLLMRDRQELEIQTRFMLKREAEAEGGGGGAKSALE